MACAFGLDAEDCAIDHWCRALGGRREGANWRAPCPLCQSPRALEYDAPGKHVRWRSFCGRHDKDAMRPALASLIGACMPGGSSRPVIRQGTLTDLALSGMPPQSLKLALLEMDGMTTAEALAALGIRRENRSRVITGRASKRMRNRRSALLVAASILMTPRGVSAHQFGCGAAGRGVVEFA